MKRIELVKTIKRFGCDLVRSKGTHDWYQNPHTGAAQPIPRHREIEEHLAKKIISLPRN